MSAVWMRFRAELRTRWRAWLGLAVLVGLASGAVIALAAGARRTDSAYPRFLRAQNAIDVVVINLIDDDTAIFDFDELARLPMVADSARGGYFFAELGDGVPAVASSDNRLGTDLNRFKILEGRRADPREPGEVVVPFEGAEEFDLGVGDTIPVFDPETIFEEIEAAPPEALPPGETNEELAEIYRNALEELPDGTVEIVGIEASPGGFPPGDFDPVHFTPAYDRLDGPNEGAEVLAVRLERGSAGVPAFRRELEARSGGEDIQIVVQRDHARNVKRSFHLQALALWLLAGFLALTAAGVISQLLARQSLLEASDYATLDALGLTRRQRFGLGLLRAGCIGVVGSLLAAVAAVGASPLFPTGLARTAEPDPGLALDGLAVGLGAMATVAVLVVVALLPAWRAARVTAAGPAALEQEARVSQLGRALSQAGLPVPAATGVRMTLDPGRGRGAVPVRSTIASVVVGVAAMAVALTVAASLDHLVRTPRLYGQTWDTALTNFSFGPDLSTLGMRALRATGDADAFAVAGAFGDPIEVEGEQASVLAFDVVEGDVRPPILEGRAPRGVDEIALGTRTMSAAGLEVGEVATVRVPGVTSARMRVVGRTVVPATREGTRLGEGAFVSLEAAFRLEPDERSDVGLLVRHAPGVEQRELRRDLEEELERLCAEAEEPGCELGTDVFAFPVTRPDSFVNFGGAEETPLVLGATLAGLAAGTLAYVLVSAVRRRRRDLALLKTLGFERRQVAASVAWHATTLVGVALVVGLPLGIAAGRWVWTILADDLGVIAVPRVPLVGVALIVPGALVLANLIAWLPARAAARTRPAVVLRAE